MEYVLFFYLLSRRNTTSNKVSSRSIPETTFRLEIPKISKLRSKIWSPKVVVRGTSWKFRVVMNKESNGKKSLGVQLYCAESKLPKGWWQQASATIKLLSFNTKLPPHKKSFEPHIYDESKTGFGFPSFIKWSDLFDKTKEYVRDDKIILELKVEAGYPFREFKKSANFEEIGISYRITVNDIENMKSICSPPFNLEGASFCLTGYSNESNQIGVCLKSLGNSNKFPINVTMCLKVSGAESREKCETTRMTGKNKFIMYFEKDWLELTYAEKIATAIDVTCKAEKLKDTARHGEKV